MIRTLLRETLSRYPYIDTWFRRTIWSRLHFPEVELQVLSRLPDGAIDVAVDVGAALGPYSWVLSRKARAVVAYEPGLQHGDFMELGARGTNVMVVRSAVGSTSGTLPLFTPADNDQGRHCATLSTANPVAVNAARHEVPVVALDTDLALRVPKNSRIDLIKIDVEGFETEVLKGAQATIQTHLPVVIAEIEVRHNPSYRDAFALLEAFGYTAHYSVGGRYRRLYCAEIEPLQRPEDLAERLSKKYSISDMKYINNFVFQHAKSKVNIT